MTFKLPVLSLVRHHAIRKLFIGLACILASSTALAWDALGHRLTGYLAYDQLNDQQKAFWMETLRAHPRFQEDFVDAMPADITAQSIGDRDRWQFGQAAIWPDIARGFDGFDEQRFHFPDRHWINGAWVRADVPLHGNIYLNTPPWPDIHGPADSEINRQSQADNVLTGLVYARWVLQNNPDAAERAVALSWLLHLIGDIHQPLHTGALVTPRLFADGDRGGNSTRVDGSNLHAVWDQALRGPSLSANLRELNDILRSLAGTRDESGPGLWLLESRQILHSSVYPAAVIANVQRSENTGTSPEDVTLGDDYRREMRAIALQRIAQAGVRITHTLQSLSPE